MPFRIKCPTGHSLVVPDSLAGKTVRCPRCQQTVVVPAIDKPAIEKEVAPLVVQPVAPPIMQAVIPPVIPPAQPPAPLHPPMPPAMVELPKPVEPVKPVELIAPPPLPPAAPPLPPAPPPPVMATPPAPTTLVAPPAPQPAPVAPPATAALPTAVSTSAAVSPAATVSAIPPAAELPPPLTHHASRLLGVYHLAAAVAGMALFSMVPGLWDVWEYWQNPDEMFIARWALVVLTIGLVQLAYAAFLWHLADWTSVWVVTLVALATAALYAMLLGITLVAGIESQLVDSLQLGDRLIHNKAELWCLCMISLATILAFFSGRMASRWQRSEAMLRAAGL